MIDAARPASTPQAVDNTDWLKTAAIIFVVVDHTGYFFIENNQWWSVFGRLAAPCFFFLMGYAQTRTVPIYWIGLGIILTVLDSANNNWTWVAPNILLSFALIRIARPYVLIALERYGWIAFGIIVAALIIVQPIAAKAVDYGAEGWFWALFGLCQRLYVDGRSVANLGSIAGSSPLPVNELTEKSGVMRLLDQPAFNRNRLSAEKSIYFSRLEQLSASNWTRVAIACFIAAAFYIWQEQKDFLFPQIVFAVLVLEVILLSLILYLFSRGPSMIQPPEPIASTLRFIGRRTLEIYAIQLAGSELIILLIPDLAP